ncbi:MAG TPA: RagB/SusD family nutrient uptake outer membrane protein, partial [Bacteroidales bacterium]|nr:RagB/SusD family nutrient uptake outer membrane protein [Bacteroidales bacterium]
VEELILTEMALETALEGHRFYDLMRVALRRGQEAYLAEKVALRKGSDNRDDALYNSLLNKNNWYLKMK